MGHFYLLLFVKCQTQVFVLPDFEQTRGQQAASGPATCECFCTDPWRRFQQSWHVSFCRMSFLNLWEMDVSFLSVETSILCHFYYQSQSHNMCCLKDLRRAGGVWLDQLIVALGISLSDLHLFPCESWQILGLQKHERSFPPTIRSRKNHG